MAGQTLEHTGAAIVEEYYPEYATTEAPVYSLYSTEIYLGSVIMLLSMAMLGLSITALGYYTDDMGVSLGIVVGAIVANVAVFLVSLGMLVMGFRKYAREDEH